MNDERAGDTEDGRNHHRQTEKPIVGTFAGTFLHDHRRARQMQLALQCGTVRPQLGKRARHKAPSQVIATNCSEAGRGTRGA